LYVTKRNLKIFLKERNLVGYLEASENVYVYRRPEIMKI